MTWSIKIGKVKGTAVKLHLTFLLFLLWIGIAFYAQGGAQAAIGGLTFLLLLFLCVVLHEFGHILAARRFGIATPEVVLLPIGGMSMLERIPERPREELLIALAGPAVSLLIAALLLLLLGGFPDPRIVLAETGGGNLLGQLAIANLTLLAFNLIPAFPLDGGRVLRALLSTRLGHLRGTRIAALIGRTAALAIGLVALMAGHVILLLIAFFIYLAAGAEVGLARMRVLTTGIPAGEAMITAFQRLFRNAPLRDASEALIRTCQREFPVVDDEDRLVGVLTRDALVAALGEKPDSTPIGEVMAPAAPAFSPWRALDGALPLLERGAALIGVADREGRLVGILTWENLLERVMLAEAGERRRAALAAPASPVALPPLAREGAR